MTQITLNDEQKLAVEHRMDWPAAVIAGAGSGKTRVLIARISHLIANNVRPHKILCVTFTNKACGEIIERLGLTNSDYRHSPRVSTTHALALAAIRKDPRGFGLGDKISPLDEYDQEQMLKKLIEARGLNEEIKHWNLKEKISYHRARGIGFAKDYTDEVHAKASKAHSGYHALTKMELEVWGDYELEKKKQSVVDFDDMLHLVVDRADIDPKWKALLSKMYEHILMDESQDTNPVQWKFINLLLGQDNLNMYVVGDGSQSIYGFSGASPDILYQYTKSFKGVQPDLYKIEDNHRSVPQVVSLANKIQQGMTDTVPLRMKSYRGRQGEKGTIRLMNELTPADNAAKTAEQIWRNNQLKEGKISFKDTAILVRSGTQINDLETELVRCRVPYIIKGGKGFLNSEEVRDILSYLRLVVNPNDVLAMRRSVSVPKRGVGDATIDKIADKAKAFGDNVILAAKAYNHNKTGPYLDFLDELTLLINSPTDAVNAILKFTKYSDILKERYKKDKDKYEWKSSNVSRFVEMVMFLQDANQELTLNDLVFQMTMNDRAEAEDQSGDGKVTISTIHSSKGLEWPKVYVANIYENSLPHIRCQTPSEIEEERRLWYVAVTRAKNELVLCVPMMLKRGNSTIGATPSRFLFECGILGQE